MQNAGKKERKRGVFSFSFFLKVSIGDSPPAGLSVWISGKKIYLFHTGLDWTELVIHWPSKGVDFRNFQTIAVKLKPILFGY